MCDYLVKVVSFKLLISIIEERNVLSKRENFKVKIIKKKLVFLCVKKWW